MLVVGAQLPLAQHAALPCLDLRHDEGQQPQAIVRRQDRHAEHFAKRAQHEKRFHRGADFQRLLSYLITEQTVEELAQRLPPPAGDGRVIIPPAMMELVGVAAVAVVAWFAAGTIWNVRKGHTLLRWMQGGLPVLGERTTVRWLGSTAIEMAIDQGKAPFASVTVLIFLEPRDVPWWPLSRLTGRRDTLIIRGALRRTPVVELEALDPVTWSGRDALPRVPREWPVRQATVPDSVVVHHASAAALEVADVLLAIAQRAGLVVGRISVRRTGANFQLHVFLPDLRQPARDFFEVVHTLAERALT